MSYWVISDTHFNHKKLEEWGKRSGTWEQQLFDGIGAIPSGDTLIHLGDICIGGDLHAHKGIKDACGRGETRVRMILVRGNHDKKTLGWYLDNGWDFVCDSFILEHMSEKVLFSHKPQDISDSDVTKNIHGHTHGNNHRSDEHGTFYDTSKHIDISPELVGYSPLRLDSIINKSNNHG